MLFEIQISVRCPSYNEITLLFILGPSRNFVLPPILNKKTSKQIFIGIIININFLV